MPTLFRGAVTPEGRKGRVWVGSEAMKAKMEEAKVGVESEWRQGEEEDLPVQLDGSSSWLCKM